ncbi:MAG: SURF1 family protein [Betaproteobacteria bacterium]|nr:SURF1 family protein [Betaproteobacteria bacterium]
MNASDSNASCPPERRRLLRCPWVPVAAALVAAAVFVSAGNWQGRRMHEKERLRAQFDAAAVADAAPLPAVDAAADWAAWRYRPVRVEGEFDGARQILVDNRIHGGRAGYHVVTPLRLADGRAVLVNRGWVAQGATRADLPAVPSPSGRVVVDGRINLPASGYLEFDSRAPDGVLWQNLDPARFAAATGLAVLPIVIEATGATAAADRLVREWPAPDFGIDKHRIYRVQWYALAGLAVGLVLYFQLRRRRVPTPSP